MNNNVDLTSKVTTPVVAEKPVPAKPEKSGWTGRRIVYAVLGALAAVAAILTGIFLLRGSKKEDEKADTPENLYHPTKDRPKVTHRAPTNKPSAKPEVAKEAVNVKDKLEELLKQNLKGMRFSQEKSDGELAEVLEMIDEEDVLFSQWEKEAIQIRNDRAMAAGLEKNNLI